MGKRYYTVEEANQLIPSVATQMKQLKQAREEITLKRLQLERMRRELGNGDPDRFFPEEAELEFMLILAKQQVQSLVTQSIEVKDIDAGLVDFLTMINGEEAYLCWRSGEASVSYWHRKHEGFSGRKPLLGGEVCG